MKGTAVYEYALKQLKAKEVVNEWGRCVCA
jgi:hypothetical protein